VKTQNALQGVTSKKTCTPAIELWTNDLKSVDLQNTSV